MTQAITTRIGATSRASAEASTRLLLSCGIVAGPLFMAVALAQAFTRPGFDLRRHAISMLSLGELGWIQVANFIVTGLLTAAMAVGVRRALRSGRAGTWGPILLGAYGLGLLGAGIFSTDPAMGFPAGAPAGMPSTLSWHATLHSAAFFVAFTGLIAACFVFARRFAGAGRRGWAAYCAGTGLAAPALIAIATTGLVPAGVALAVLGGVTSAWVAVLAARLRSEVRA
jgi:Protein of unknown function (DUF998)